MAILGQSARIDSVAAILRESADRDPGAAAILAPDIGALSYGALAEQTARIGAQLRSFGITSRDRVALALQNGPELATAFLAIAAAAGCAPLNPNYRKSEFEFYLGDLRAAALVVGEQGNREAEAAANALGIRILRAKSGECAGEFRFGGNGVNETSAPGWASGQETALLLHTSGTTARPKLVPLTGANLAASARNIDAALALTPADRCLNIMPLFHIHGLIAGILAPLSAGGEICCTPGFNALKFFGWMGEAHPTWYTAVPTMHQAILTRAGKNADVIKANPLRFIRSSSSSLPPQVIRELEQTFGAPVIEAYGMTEAAHQMAS
ncbi:MAG TPA: AMP-binding protein, partial [Bryobacteraceae bacterium]